jgi:hypothetical protein
MTSARYLSFFGYTTLLCAALALSLGSASAQIAEGPDYSSSVSDSLTESSSNPPAFAENSRTGEAAAELSATPKFEAIGGGQYDNRTSPGGGGGFKSHLTYEFGGGFNAPTSDSSPYITWGWNFMAGGGYRFDKHFSTNIQYDYVHSKLPGAIIDQAGATGGYVTLWSFTLNPMYEFNPKSAITFYAVGGGGFYRKVTSFTDPIPQYYCQYFYGCGVIITDAVVGHFSSNQGGWNVGGGIEHRFAGWNGDGKMKVFAEVRYLDVLSPAVTTEPNGLGTTTIGEDTKIIPVTIGLRW